MRPAQAERRVIDRIPEGLEPGDRAPIKTVSTSLSVMSVGTPWVCCAISGVSVNHGPRSILAPMPTEPKLSHLSPSRAMEPSWPGRSRLRRRAPPPGRYRSLEVRQPKVQDCAAGPIQSHSLPRTPAVPRASMPCCRSSTCRHPPPATSMRRFPPPRSRGSQPFAGRDLAAHGRMGEGARALAAPQSLGAPVRLHSSRSSISSANVSANSAFI